MQHIISLRTVLLIIILQVVTFFGNGGSGGGSGGVGNWTGLHRNILE